jgi:RNA polymerase sigma factor (sigma-70 family)
MPDTSISLLERLHQQPNADDWTQLTDLYTPVLKAWLRRYEVLAPADVDDLVQDVLLTVSKELPSFQHSGRPGAFRTWLRGILVNRLKHFWRSRQNRPLAVGGSDFLDLVQQLHDDGTPTSQLWDEEHNRQLIRRLFEMVEPRFTGPTWQAFRLQVVDGLPAEKVVAELKMPLHSVYAAKSRVLQAMRALAERLV